MEKQQKEIVADKRTHKIIFTYTPHRSLTASYMIYFFNFGITYFLYRNNAMLPVNLLTFFLAPQMAIPK